MSYSSSTQNNSDSKCVGGSWVKSHLTRLARSQYMVHFCEGYYQQCIVHTSVKVFPLWHRWQTQKQTGCRPSSAGTRTSVGNTQMGILSPNSTRTSSLFQEAPGQTGSSTWPCHPPSTTMLPRTLSTTAWAQSQYTFLSLMSMCHTACLIFFLVLPAVSDCKSISCKWRVWCSGFFAFIWYESEAFSVV